ncbi:LysR substrate-binding domain-containing protein [Denitromonas iodatirespirans]|uniref:LysR family transcriptional regulator n=1 Tax=Denitromonas iodatirespirans TaxID=2795389 RepID=A0A944HDQ2_DENI1|nr:LysR substrate-binding domain-containing protein [Denitromonas iodatirespirans]MBT0962216.1 LysR family transcriptional regulator [Denitromonas iodatirespirans]
MNLHLLRVFVTVVEANSFSRAADLLGISQPATSKAVKELEHQLDTVLLDRQGKRFVPSAPGQALYDYGRTIFALEREADEAVKSYSALERGHLVIGASTTIATYWLPPSLLAFRQHHPGVTVSVISANTDHIAELLLDCRVDVALVEGEVSDPRIDIRPWRSEEMIVVAPRAFTDEKADPASLASCLWVMRERGSGSRAAAERILAEQQITPAQVIEVGSNEAIVQSVAAGIGLGLVPRICARDQLALGRVRKHAIGSQACMRQLYRMRLPRRPVSQPALAFEALLAGRTA